MNSGHQQWISLGYLLMALLVVGRGLWNRSRGGGDPWRPLTAQYGDYTYGGVYCVTDHKVIVRCEAGAMNRLVGESEPERTAEEVLIDIYRNAGRLE